LLLAVRHSLRDAPAVIGPPSDEGVDDVDVVVVVGAAVVVVVGGVVVVTDPPPDVPPPPPDVPPLPPLVPPPPAPPLDAPAGAVVVVVATTEVTVTQRFTRPENWLLLDSEARVRTISVRNALESRPPKAEAEASMFTMAMSATDATPNVRTFGMRCVVFARKKFLSEPLYMKYKFAGSNHTPTYEISILPQIELHHVDN